LVIYKNANSEVTLLKLLAARLVAEVSVLIDPEVLLACSQEPNPAAYPKPAGTS